MLATALVEEAVSPDEAAVVKEFIAFLEETSKRRHPTGPIRRFNQGRAAACVRADFTVREDLDPKLRVGLFAEPRTYRAYIRFANAASKTDRDKDVRGMSISLASVPGMNLTPGSTTQDFVLNSHPVMMAPNTREFLALLRAVEAGGLRTAFYFLTHPAAARVAFASRRNPTSHLDIWYWSTTPYLYGPERAVKYAVRPSSERKSQMPTPLTETYLSDALRAHLQQADASFDFMVQFQVDERRTPIEDATVEWKEQDSPYIPVARIVIPRQQVDDPSKGECENSAFNPWHALAEHRPLGNMNRARKEIYTALAQFRRARRS
jgi:catalase